MQDERLSLVEQFAAQERTRAEICRGFGVSRKTGYKWFEQFLLYGVAGLADRSRRPHHQPQAVDEATIGAIVDARSHYPSWGERKLYAWLERERPERSWPCPSTIGAILKRYGLTHPPKRRRPARSGQPSLGHRLQGLVPYPGRNPLRSVDDLRHAYALSAALPGDGSYRREVRAAADGSDLPRVRFACSHPL